MADRRTPLVNGEYYHIFNRGVARQPTFTSKRDYEQALLTLSYYRLTVPSLRLSRFKSLSIEQRRMAQNQLLTHSKYVEIVCFVFMPNHFHFLLKQVRDNGISKFIGQFTNSYTRYFNTKNERVGSVFQGVFKSVRVESEEQLLHLSRYIHLNPLVSIVIRENELFSYPWSSLHHFLNDEQSFVYKKPIMEYFKSKEEYRNFILDQVDYGKALEQIKHLILED